MVAADTAVVDTVGEVVVGAAITGAVGTEVGERAVQKPAKLTLAPPGFRTSCGFRNSPSTSFFRIRPAPI